MVDSPKAGGFGRMSSLRANTTMLAMTQQASNKRIKLKSNASGYGFSLSTQPWLVHGLNHFVSRVDPGSPASKAGLRVGDKLLELDDTPTVSLSHKMLASLLAEAAESSKSVVLVISSKSDALDKLNAYSVGDQIEAKYAEDGKWYPAVVNKLNMDEGNLEVSYTGYDESATLQVNQVRLNDAALPPYWVAAFAGDGEKYYYNTITNKTSWEFPTPENELDGVSAERWVENDKKTTTTTDDEQEDDSPDMVAFKFGKLNREYATYRIHVDPEGEMPYQVYGGKCQFGGRVGENGLKAPLFFDVLNPKAVNPFDMSKNSNKEKLPGSIVLVERGEVAVTTKVKNCQDAGAIGCIVINTDLDATLFSMAPSGDGSEDSINIPATNLVASDGLDLITTLQEGIAVNVKLESIVDEPMHAFFMPGDVQAEPVDGFKVTDIGKPVTVKNEQTGTLAFIGLNSSTKKPVCGVALDKDGGKKSHNGTVDGVCYFICDAKSGILVPPRHVKLLSEATVEIQIPQSIEGFDVSCIGSRCTVKKQGGGTVRFVGYHKLSNEPRVGVELDKPTGKNNGTVSGVKYFMCAKLHGLLTPPRNVTLDNKAGDMGIVDSSDEEMDVVTPMIPQRPPPKSALRKDSSSKKSRRVSFSDVEGGDLLQLHNYTPESSDAEDGGGGYTLYKAMYDYSSDDPSDLLFKAGDILRVTDEGDGPESWFYGSREEDGLEGSFPGTFVRKVGIGGSSGGGGQMFSFGGATSEDAKADDETFTNYLVKADAETTQEAVLAAPEGSFLVRKINKQDKHVIYVNHEEQITKLTIKGTDGEYEFQDNVYESLDDVINSIKQSPVATVKGKTITLTSPAKLEDDKKKKTGGSSAGGKSPAPMSAVQGFDLSTVGKPAVSKKYGIGVIRFVGLHVKKQEPRIGLELTSPGAEGKHNGTVAGQPYFDCPDSKGVLVPISDITLSAEGETTTPAGQMKEPKEPVLDLAGFAAADKQAVAKMEKVEVVIKKKKAGLGMSLAGPERQQHALGLYIQKVKPDGASAGKVKPYQRIFAINGTDVTYASRKDAIAVLKSNTKDKVKLVVSKAPDTAGYSKQPTAVSNTQESAPATAAAGGGNAKEAPPQLATKLVTINKGGNPLGLTIIGPKSEEDENVGVYIQNVKDGPSKGLVESGQRIYSVNGKDMTHALKAECVAEFKASGGVVKILLSEKPDTEGFGQYQGNKAVRAGKTVSVTKGDDEHLGLSLVGRKDDQDMRLGIFISKIEAGSPAEGKLELYQRVLGINGTDTKALTRPQCFELMAQAPPGSTVKFNVGKPDKASFAMFESPYAKREELQALRRMDVTVYKNGPLGISLAGKKTADDSRVGVFISKIKPDSPAQGLLQVQQRIFVVNGQDVTSASKAEVQRLMKEDGPLRLNVSESPDVVGYDLMEKAGKTGKAAPPSGNSAAAVASTASSSGDGDTETHTFSTNVPLGIGFQGKKNASDSRVGIYISKIKPESPAQGVLKVKQRILSCNGTDTRNATKQDIVDLIKGHSQPQVTFVVSSQPDEAGFAAFEKKKDSSSAAATTPSSGSGSVMHTFSLSGPLGIGFQGKKSASDAREGIYISKIKSGSPALGKLEVKQRILSVNGHDTRSLCKNDVIDLIKANPDSVTFEVTAQPDEAGFAAFEKVKKKDLVDDAPPTSTPFVTRPPEEAAPTPAPTTSSTGGSQYEGLGRLKLLKLCRERNLDYQGISKDVDAIIALLVQSDGGSIAPVESTTPYFPPPEPEPPVSSPTLSTSSNPFLDDPSNPFASPMETVPTTVSPPPPSEPAPNPFLDSLPGPGGADSSSAGPYDINPFAAPAGSENDGYNDEYSSMGRLQLLKLCRDRGLDYTSIGKDVVALRQLLRNSDGGSSSHPEPEPEMPPFSLAPPPAPADDPPAPTTAPPPPPPSSTSGSDYASKGRLALVKMCKDRGLDYMHVAKDKDGLISLLEQADVGGSGGDSVSSAPQASRPDNLTLNDLDLPREAPLTSPTLDRPRNSSKRPPTRGGSSGPSADDEPVVEEKPPPPPITPMSDFDYSIPEKERLARLANPEETEKRMEAVTFDFSFK